MVKDELLPKQFVNCPHHEKRIRRVVSVDDIKPLSCRDIETQNETRGCEVDVLPEVTHNDLEFVQQRPGYRTPFARKLVEQGESSDPVHGDAIYDLAGFFGGAQECDDRDFEAVLDQRKRLVPDARVLRKAVLNQHQDPTSIFLHGRGPSVDLSQGTYSRGRRRNGRRSGV